MDHSIGVPINAVIENDEDSEFYVQKMTNGGLCFRMLSCCRNCYVSAHISESDLIMAIREAEKNPSEQED
jgi:hypothetical protein